MLQIYEAFFERFEDFLQLSFLFKYSVAAPVLHVRLQYFVEGGRRVFAPVFKDGPTAVELDLGHGFSGHFEVWQWFYSCVIQQSWRHIFKFQLGLTIDIADD